MAIAREREREREREERKKTHANVARIAAVRISRRHRESANVRDCESYAVDRECLTSRFRNDLDFPK